MSEAAVQRSSTKVSRAATNEAAQRNSEHAVQKAAAPAAEKISAKSTSLQAKLAVGAQDDPLEREADAKAEQVMRKPDSGFPLNVDENDHPRRKAEEAQKAPEQPQKAANEVQKAANEVQKAGDDIQKAPEGVQMEKEDEEYPVTEEDEKEGAKVFLGGGDEKAQKKDEEGQEDKSKAHEASKEFEKELQEAKSGGMPLPTATKEFMEGRFGVDFSRVRVHTDKQSDRLNKQIGAKAFAIGNHVFFSSGRFQPESDEGKFLLAHELTHVVQQGAAVKKSPDSLQKAEEKPQKSPEVQKAEEKPQKAEEAQATSLIQKKEEQVSTTEEKVQGGWVREKINKYARQVPGYSLITVIIGYNPILDEDVPRNAENLVGGIMGIVPGGTVLFDQLKESGALQDAFDWLASEVDKLNLSWGGIKALIDEAWDKVSITNSFSENLQIIKDVFGPTVRRIIDFGKAILTKVAELIFKGALKLVGAPVEKVMALFNKGKAVLEKIFSDPIGFIMNLANAVKMGLQLFMANLKKNLIDGVVTWLTGAISGAGITLPEKFDLKGIFHLVLQVLGLTYAQIRPVLVKHLGEKTVKRAEKLVEIVKLLVTKGPMALWEKIKEGLSDLKDKMLDAFRNWITVQVVTEAIKSLLLMLNPAGALLKMAMALYNIVKFFIERWQQIVDFATSVFDSIGAIANGSLAAAAKFVEGALVKALPVMIGFFASFVGLGNISQEIKKVIEKIRKPVDTAKDKAIAWIVAKGKAFIKKAKDTAKKAIDAARAWLKQKEPVKLKSGEKHTLSFKEGAKGEKPVLMMASDPAPMSDHDKKIKAAVDKAKAELPEKSGEILAIYSQHVAKITQINTKLDNLKKEDKERGTAGNAAEIQELKDEAKILEQLLDIIQVDADGKLDLKPTVVSPGGLKDGFFATSMVANPLTRKGDPGSEPGVSHDPWKALTERRNGGSSFYVRGHLLNENTHGTGGNWNNLAPLTVGANSQHKNDIEGDVKKAVNDGKTLYYEVHVDYPAAAKNSIGSDADIPQRIKDAGQGEALKRVLAAEKYIPERFRCKAYVLDPKTGAEDTKGNKDYGSFGSSKVITVKNEVGAIGSYDLGSGAPKRVLTHLNMFEPKPKELDGRTMAAHDAARAAYAEGLAGIAETRADYLFKNRKEIKDRTALKDLMTRGAIPEKFLAQWEGDPKISFGPGAGVTQWSPAYESSS